MKILLTGITGFVGQWLAARLCQQGHQVVAPVRSSRVDAKAWQAQCCQLTGIPWQGDLPVFVPLKDWLEVSAWEAILSGVAVVIHCAAKVHQINNQPTAQVYQQINSQLTQRLAIAAKNAGVQQFIFLSSIKVHGEPRHATPLTEASPIDPQDPYAQSKWEAEQALQCICREGAMQYTILRPPLIIGPGVKANFLRLMQLAQKGWPLPMANCQNQRSLLTIHNLVDAIYHCLLQPSCFNQAFVVADPEPVSTCEMIRLMNSEGKLWSFPRFIIKTLAACLGKKAVVQRLWGDYTVDCRKLQQAADWQPAFVTQHGIIETTHWYLSCVKPARDCA